MYTFIVNPHARSGLGQKVWDDLEVILRRQGISYEVYYTKYQKHATAITAQITSDGYEHTIVALGGDGTVNEVVNGIQDFSKTIFGYIPIGSSNDFARGLKLPTDPKEALENILDPAYLLPINVGELRYKNKYRRFAVSSGIGFDADICHEAVVSHVKYFLNKLKLGKLTYACIAIHRLFLTKPDTITITLDHKKTVSFPNAYFVAIMNNRYEGGGVKFCPKAKVDDDKLDIMVASNISKLKVLALIPLAFFGWHTPFKGVHIYKCEHMSAHTKQALPVHTDGEPIFLQHDISVCCAPKKLRVIMKNKL